MPVSVGVEECVVMRPNIGQGFGKCVCIYMHVTSRFVPRHVLH